MGFKMELSGIEVV